MEDPCTQSDIQREPERPREREGARPSRDTPTDECDKEAGVAENTHGSCPCFRTQVPDQLQTRWCMCVYISALPPPE